MLQHEIRGNLAKLLAVENIIVEHKPIDGACFDVVERVLTLPLWDKASEDVYQMLILHEVGHAKYTPTESWVENFEQYGATLNILEDARIEKLIKTKYPGSRKTFHSAYKELFESNFFKITDINSYNFIDRINLYFKVGTHVKVNFNDDEKIIINRIENSSTFEDILDICKEIYDLIQSDTLMSMKIPIPTSDYKLGNGSGGDTLKINIPNSFNEFDRESKNSNNSKENNSGDQSSSGEQGGSSNQSSSGEQASSGEQNTSEDVNELSTKDLNHNDTETQNDKSLKDLLDSETYKSFSDSIKTLSDNFSASVRYVELPEIYIDNIIVSNEDVQKILSSSLQESDFSKNKFREFKDSSKREVSYLVKEFESKKAADLFMRARQSKTGVLDCTKLFSYKYNENIFKSTTTIPEGKNHGLIFILDWSGSMSSCILDTYKQLCCLVWFCKKVNIPFDIYSFTNSFDNHDSLKCFKKEKDKLAFGKFTLMNIISSRNKKNSVDSQIYNMFNLIINRMWTGISGFGMGGTPLNESLAALNCIIPKFMEDTRVQKLQCVVLTDGEANNSGVWSASKSSKYNTSNVHLESIPEGSFIRDRKLKTTYKVLSGNFSYLTNPLLKNLTDRFPYCNFIGIRLLDTHYLISFMNQQNIPLKDYSKYKEIWSNTGSCSLESTGYFKYFAIKRSSMKLDSSFDFEDKTEKQIKNEFRRKLSQRQTNKKMLSEFIQIIS